jgi:ATP-dependent Zn protease
MNSADWIGLFLNWLPMLIVLGIWFYLIWMFNWRKGYGTQFQRDLMEQTKKQTDLLERIATSLEKNNSK